MKKLILSMALALLAGVVMAQTDFRQISYQEGLDAAKKEGKLLFVDFYTEWCGPCKILSNDVFPREDVGNFMNEHFVCLKIDSEKGEGVELSKKFEIKSVPTCMIVRPDGIILHRLVGGSNDWEGYLDDVKMGLNEKTSLLYLNARYESGKITKKELAVYYTVLMRAAEIEKAEKIKEELLPQLTEKDKLNADYWGYMEMTAKPGDEDFALILANLPKIEKNIGKEKLDKFLYGRYYYCLYLYVNRRDVSKIPTLEELKKGIDQIDIVQQESLLKLYELADICVKKDGPRFVKYCEKLLEEEDGEWNGYTLKGIFDVVEGMSKEDCKRLITVIDKMSAQSSGYKSAWDSIKGELEKQIKSEESK